MVFKKKKSLLTGKCLLINAGPTFEKIDPVRFIGNYSSGKMGIAVATEASARGAEVTLILGPVPPIYIPGNIRVVNVESAAGMAEATISRFPQCDIAILAAAVADFTPADPDETKIKRNGDEMLLRLKPTMDIAAHLGSIKRRNQIVAGFALETDNALENAKEKLLRKKLDMIVLNSLEEEGAGFGFNTNRITIIDKNNNIDKFELKSKSDVASDILDKIEKMLSDQ